MTTRPESDSYKPEDKDIIIISGKRYVSVPDMVRDIIDDEEATQEILQAILTETERRRKAMSHPSPFIQEAELALLEWLDLSVLVEDAAKRLSKALMELQPAGRVAAIALRQGQGKIAEGLESVASLTREAIDRAASRSTEGPPLLREGSQMWLTWKQHNYEAGTAVQVLDLHNSPLGQGTLLHPYDADRDDNVHPEIKMPDGRILRGCECWWIPVKEVEDGPEGK